VILVLFAVGHTFGFLNFRPATLDGLAVKTAMDKVAFPFGNASRTYGELYRGFGLFVTAYLLFAALTAWELPRLLVTAPDSFRTIAVGLFAVQLVTAMLSWMYFALPPAVLSSAVVACLAWTSSEDFA
jgi:hypothetical protein